LQQRVGFACDALAVDGCRWLSMASNNITVLVQTGSVQLSSICYRFTPILPVTKLRAFT